MGRGLGAIARHKHMAKLERDPPTMKLGLGLTPSAELK